MHLATGIVDVIFPLYLVPHELEQGRKRRTEGGTPAVADMQRTGWIRGNEVDLAFIPLPLFAGTETFALLQNTLHHGVTDRAANEEVDEPRARYFHLVDTVLRRQICNNRFRQCAWRHAGLLRQGQGDVRGEITLARILGRRDLDIDVEIGGKLRILLQLAQGLRDQIVDDLLQEVKARIRNGKMNRDFTRAGPPLPHIFCTLSSEKKPTNEPGNRKTNRSMLKLTTPSPDAVQIKKAGDSIPPVAEQERGKR